MAIPQHRDPAKTRRILTDWLATKLEGASNIDIEVAGANEVSGFSSDTIIFDAVFDRNGTAHRGGYVVRAAPVGAAVFEDYEIGLQFKVIKAVGEHSDVPVPTVLWLEEDASVLGAPFMVMERLSGRVPSDNPPYTLPKEFLPADMDLDPWVASATSEQQRTMWLDGIDTLVKIAKIDWRALGLDELDRKRFGKLGQEQLFGYQREYYNFATRSAVPCVEHAWKWLEANRPDDDHLVTFSWGDARLGNLMFDENFNVKAVFDWEMVRVGNPEFDLAWYLWFDKHFTDGIGLPRLPGFPSDEECIARWETAMGRKAEHLEFYTVFTMVWFASIMARVIQTNIEHGAPDAQDMAPMETNNLCTQLLAKHFGLAPPESV